MKIRKKKLKDFNRCTFVHLAKNILSFKTASVPQNQPQCLSHKMKKKGKKREKL